MNSELGKTFLFLTNLAWKSRITLPALITFSYLAFNFRWQVEINIHTERIPYLEDDMSDQSYETITDDDTDDDIDEDFSFEI